MEELLKPDSSDQAVKIDQLDSSTLVTASSTPSNSEPTNCSSSDDGSCPDTPITAASSESDNDDTKNAESEAHGVVKEKGPAVIEVSTTAADDLNIDAVFGQGATDLDEKIVAVEGPNNQTSVQVQWSDSICSIAALDLALSSEDDKALGISSASWVDLAVSDAQLKEEWPIVQKSPGPKEPVLHHLNFSGRSVFHPSATSPEISL